MSTTNQTKPVRHCMVVYAAYPHLETRVQREAEALINNGHEVDLICPVYHDEPLLDHHQGVTIHRLSIPWERQTGLGKQLRTYFKFLTLASFKLTKLHLKKHFNVIQVHNLPDFLVFAAFLPKILGARVILDLHDLSPEFFQSYLKKSKRHWLVRLVFLQERLSCRFANHVITVSEIWRQSLIKRGVPAEKCSSVMNLADPRIYRPRTQEEVDARDSKTYRLFYHGDFSDRYDLDLVVKAVAELRSKIPPIQLVLVGGGRNEVQLKQLVSDLSLDETAVRFIGPAPAEQLYPLFTLADIGIVPLRNDVFSDLAMATKLMEFAVMGIPTIVSRNTAHSTYFDDNMVQFFTPSDYEDLKRSLLLVYENKKRREEITKGILKFNELHNWAKESAAYVGTVEHLANSRKAKHQ